MRLYRIETMEIMVTVTEFEEDPQIMVTSQIVPEHALGEYDFTACEYIGDLDEAFELKRRETPESDEPEGNVLKLKKDD